MSVQAREQPKSRGPYDKEEIVPLIGVVIQPNALADTAANAANAANANSNPNACAKSLEFCALDMVCKAVQAKATANQTEVHPRVASRAERVLTREVPLHRQYLASHTHSLCREPHGPLAGPARQAGRRLSGAPKSPPRNGPHPPQQTASLTGQSTRQSTGQSIRGPTGTDPISQQPLRRQAPGLSAATTGAAAASEDKTDPAAVAVQDADADWPELAVPDVPAEAALADVDLKDDLAKKAEKLSEPFVIPRDVWQQCFDERQIALLDKADGAWDALTTYFSESINGEEHAQPLDALLASVPNMAGVRWWWRNFWQWVRVIESDDSIRQRLRDRLQRKVDRHSVRELTKFVANSRGVLTELLNERKDAKSLKQDVHKLKTDVRDLTLDRNKLAKCFNRLRALKIQLETELNTAKSERAKDQEKYAELKTRTDADANQNAELKKQLEAELADTKSARAKDQERQAELRAEVNRLTQQLMSSAASHGTRQAELQAQIDGLRADAQRLNAEHSSQLSELKRAHSGQLSDLSVRHAQQMAALKADLAEAHAAQMAELKDAHTLRLGEIQGLKADLDALERKTASFTAERAKWQAEVSELSSQLAAEKQQLQGLLARVSGLVTTNDALAQANETLRQQSAESKRELASERDRVQAELAGLGRQMIALRDELARSTCEKASVLAQNEQLNSSVVRLRSDVSDLSMRLSAQDATVVKLNQTLADQSSTIVQLKNDLQAQRDIAADKDRMIADLFRDVQANQRRILELTEDNKALKQANAALTAELAASQSTIALLKQQNTN